MKWMDPRGTWRTMSPGCLNNCLVLSWHYATSSASLWALLSPHPHSAPTLFCLSLLNSHFRNMPCPYSTLPVHVLFLHLLLILQAQVSVLSNILLLTPSSRFPEHCDFLFWLPFPLEPKVIKVRDCILLISLSFLSSSVACTQSFNKLINE